MADTRPPDYSEYTKRVARGAQARNKQAIESDKRAIAESRGFEAMARSGAKATHYRADPKYYKLEREERAGRRAEISQRQRAGRGDWAESVRLKRKSKRGGRKSTR